MSETPKQESPVEERYNNAFFKAQEYLVSLKKYPEKGWDEDETDEDSDEDREDETELEFTLDQVMTNLDELRSKGDETAGTLLTELVSATENKLGL